MIDKINDDSIVSIEYSDNVFDGTKVVGTFYKNVGSLEVFNYDDEYTNLVGDEIVIDEVGTWVVNKIENNVAEKKATFEIYDLSYKFDNIYEDVFVSGMTIYEWLETICEKCGVELGSTSFPNSDYILINAPFIDESYTYRNVIQMIAESAGCYAKLDNDYLKIEYFDEDNSVIVADWTELSLEVPTSSINIVVLGNDLEDNILYPSEVPDSPVELRINNNQIIYLDSEGMIEQIYDNVVGTNTTPFSLSFEKGMVVTGSLKSGCSIVTYDTDYNVINLKVMNITANFNGTWSYVVTSEIPTETETEYQYAGTVTKTINETSAKVDKINQEIELIITTNDETKETLTELQIEVGSITDTVSQTGGDNLISNSRFYQNADLWLNNDSADFTVDTSSNDVLQNTVCKSELTLNNGILQQRFWVELNKEHTLTYKYKKNGTISKRSYVEIGDDYLVYLTNEYTEEQEDRLEVTTKFTPTNDNVLVASIYTDNDAFSITDFVLRQGTSTIWSTSADEVSGLGHKLDSSQLTLYDLGNLDNQSISTPTGVTYTTDGVVDSYYTKTEFKTDSGDLTQLTFGNVTIKNLSDDNLIIF